MCYIKVFFLLSLLQVLFPEFLTAFLSFFYFFIIFLHLKQIHIWIWQTNSIFNQRTGYLVLLQTDKNIFSLEWSKGQGSWQISKHDYVFSLKPTAERTHWLKKSFTFFFFWMKFLILFIWAVIKWNSFLWFPNNKFHRCIWQNDNIKLIVHSPGTKSWHLIEMSTVGNHSWKVCGDSYPTASARRFSLQIPLIKDRHVCIVYVCSVPQSCPALCDPMDRSPSVSAVYGIFLSQNTGESCHFLLQCSFSTQGPNALLLQLLYWQADFFLTNAPPGKPKKTDTEHLIFEDPCFMHWRRKWRPTPVFLPGESQGRGSLVGCCLWGCTESDTTEAT